MLCDRDEGPRGEREPRAYGERGTRMFLKRLGHSCPSISVPLKGKRTARGSCRAQRRSVTTGRRMDHPTTARTASRHGSGEVITMCLCRYICALGHHLKRRSQI